MLETRIKIIDNSVHVCIYKSSYMHVQQFIQQNSLVELFTDGEWSFHLFSNYQKQEVIEHVESICIQLFYNQGVVTPYFPMVDLVWKIEDTNSCDKWNR